MSYEIKSDTLYLWNNELKHMNSGAIIDTIGLILTRMNNGSTIFGTWLWVGISYRILSGTPTLQEIDSLNHFDNLINSLMNWGTNNPMILDISQNAFVNYNERTWADQFIYKWNTQWSYTNTSGDSIHIKADSFYYDINVTKIDDRYVSLKGNKTNEIVMIKENNLGDVIYTSNDTIHTTYTCYKNPIVCPNDEYPEWYYNEFKENNRKNKFTLKMFNNKSKVIILNPFGKYNLNNTGT
jgi:hypothetical protein